MAVLVALLSTAPAAAQDEADATDAEDTSAEPEDDEIEEAAPEEDEPSASDPAEAGAADGSSTSEVDDRAEAQDAEADDEPEADDLGVDPYLPGMELPDDDPGAAVYEDEADADDDDLPDGKPFAKGDMEVGLGLGGFGGSEYFVLGLGGTFAYYVVNRFAPGIDLSYTHTFSDRREYPDSLTTLPFLKFVIIRSTKFAPYVMVAGGRDFQWGGSSNPTKGIRAADAWIFGGGLGAHIGIGDHFAIKLQILALYYWYDDTRVSGFKDSVFTETDENGDKYAWVDDDYNVGCDPNTEECYQYFKKDDWKDKDGELFFPLITIGFAFFF